MNTKASVGMGWLIYTAAFCVGGGYGLYKYYYQPGGRKDREEVAERERLRREAEEAEYEERIREERRRQAARS